ncbi:N-terminal domain of NEFA-interacting nuclear protein NIP30-domain-containing protein [Rhypophila decipiens]|uniref:N-terminal domain of NEFA-interacting nuclear protein NIP30-domain-containing protein n=1 Tax=Rhypophila decipiens TaxID=261697 RepID=A0AAN6Y622_9PEZI|nr:N-terminal domain of NEFA-interacting nuclear protein NIP30-domain-containing protein [Rhypophila decipiens]
MSSRFVSAGSFAVEAGKPSIPVPASTSPSQPEEPLNPKSAEWLAVETQLAQERENRLQAKRKAAAAGAEEKSLYEVLQANKAAKQAAFEEANKIKNQFRALDDDEIDFLDEVLMRKRAEEQRIRRETEEGLDLFRRAQQMGGNKSDEEGEEMEVTFEGRKRRRKGQQHEGEGKSKRMLVRKKTSGEGQDPEKETAERDKSQATTVAEQGPSTGSTAKAEEVKPAVAVVGASKPTTTTKTGTSASSGGGGLGGLILGYGSSDEDDD